MKGKMGKKKRKNSERSLLRYYLVGYIVVLFIPLTICSACYRNMIKTISEDDVQKRKNDLNHSMALVDTMLNEMGYLGDSLAINAEVNKFKRVTDPFEYPKAYQVNKLQAQLPELYQINPSILDYFIFFNNSDMVINKSIAYEYRDFYDLYMRPASSGSYEQWYDSIKNTLPGSGLQPAEVYDYMRTGNNTSGSGEEKKTFLVYDRPLLLNSGGSDSSGLIRFYIECSYIDTLMPDISDKAGGGGAFLITNRKKEPLYFKISNEMVSGEQLLEITEEEDSFIKFDGRRYLLVHLESKDSGLNYYTLYPEKSVSTRKTSAMITVIFSIATAAFAGLMLSFYMSRKSAKSVSEVLKEISKETEYYDSHRTVFSHLKTTYSRLIRENSVLTDAIEQQRPFICSALINRLIYGDYLPAEEMKKILVSLEIPWQNRRLCVLVLRFYTGEVNLMDQDTSLEDSCAISFLEIFEQKVPDSLYSNAGDGQVVLILNEEECGAEQFRELAEQRIREVMEELPVNIADRIFICGGSQVTQFSDIHKSYEQAVYMVQKKNEQSGNVIMWYNDNSDVMPLYPPADMEIRLTHLVLSGDEKGLHDELEELLNIYIIKNTMPLYLQQMFLSEMQIIMFRILSVIDMEKEECLAYYQQLEKHYDSSLLEQITKTIRIYGAVCGYVGQKRQGTDAGKIVPSVVSYMELHYGDNSLSLSSVAADFDLSESQLSTIFKQAMGMNFSAYLEGIRIDKAKELLRTTKMKVGDISEAVGYYSANRPLFFV